MNPADALSRGQTPIEFLRNESWFNVYDWLLRSESAWPAAWLPREVTLPGLKRISCLLSTPVSTNAEEPAFYLKFSSYYTLINTIAYCLRFRRPSGRDSKFLNRAERDEAEIRLWKLIQGERYANELECIKNTGTTKNTRLAAFSPFIDESGVLRVGGRLVNPRIPDCQKYPVLLPSYHHVTDLIIREVHNESLHAGLHSTLFTIRHRFWLLNGKNQVRRIIRRCNACVRHRPVPLHGKMGDLPSSRVQQSDVFSHVGVDFFGPILLRWSYTNKFRKK